MSEEEYKNRIGKIDAEISTDRLDADRGLCLLLQKLYLKDRYIEGLQQKVEQLENIRKEAIKLLKKCGIVDAKGNFNAYLDTIELKDLLNILNKGSEEK